jgi:hypothetical protein
MAKTSLAFIHKHVDALLTQELRSPTPHREHAMVAAQPRIIAGFEVMDPRQSVRLLEEAREHRRAVIQHYMDKKKELGGMLDEVGCVPEAIIPTATFRKICQDTDMYFVPSKMKSFVYTDHFLDWMKPGPEGVTVDSVDSAEWTGRRTVIGSTRRAIKPTKGRTVEGYRAEFTHDQVMRSLLKTPERHTGHFFFSAPTDGKSFPLILPVPPAEVVDKLMRVADLNPQTVAVYGAMDFVGGVEVVLNKILQREIKRQEEEEQKRVDWMLNDPIVYITRGPVTAVIAQFGPFPIEREVIERVTATDFLPPTTNTLFD